MIRRPVKLSLMTGRANPALARILASHLEIEPAQTTVEDFPDGELPGEPVGARLLADLLSIRIQRLIVLDLHNPANEGFFALPVEHLTAVPLLAETIDRLHRSLYP